MLDVNTLNKFIRKANPAHQQFCVWFATNNLFAKHQTRWNKLDPEIESFTTENFIRKHGCKYKNFWSIILPTLQHGWVLSTARLFDPAYNVIDKKKLKPRISLDYILIQLDDEILSDNIRQELKLHSTVIDSLMEHRHNFHAHNDANFANTRIEAGIENLFQWLEDIIEIIKKNKPYLNNCGVINIKYNEKLSQCGVDEVFETLLLGEKHEK
ncbi:MAG: hypothetical protein NUV47_02275 [Patescibacteria group bacterium]|nr:hypothetical protein [Patescibacteria group bacterium]